MPTHVWQPKNEQANLWDRLKIHSTEVGLAIIAMLTSIQVWATPLFKEYAPSISLRGIDPALALSLAAFIGTGGLLSLIGVLWDGKRISTGWMLEQVGCLLVAFGWIGYGCLVAYSFPYSTIAYGMAIGLGLIAFARAYVVWRIERSIRPGAEVAKKLRTGKGQ